MHNKQMDFKVEPWKHQLDAIEKSFHHRDFALLWDPGTGKTGTAINILRGRYATNKRVMRTLILAPLVVLQNWKKEFGLHSKIDSKLIFIPEGVGAKRVEAIKKALYSESLFEYCESKIVIMNYDAIINKDISKILKLWKPEILVCDESHRCKNFKSKRAQAVAELADKALHRYILTGTPILNSSEDIFMQYRILDGGETFGVNPYAFRAMFFEDVNAGWSSKPGYFPKYVPKPHTYELFNQRIYQKATRARKEECLDLPEFVRTERFVELGKEQKRMYEDMRDEYITFIEDLEAKGEPKTVIANLAITKSLRLQQILTGFAKDDEGTVHKIEDNPRLKVLEEVLEDLVEGGHKVIVWAVFKENYKQIAELLTKMKINFVELHGDISNKDKQENMNTFRTDAGCKVILANQASGGIGVNLVEASYAVYFSRGFSLEQDLQSEARNYRGGSEIHQKITRIDLVTQNTIDELVLEALRNKLNIAEKVLSWPKEKL